MRVLLCVFVLSCAAGTFAGTLPSYIKACSASDPNLNQCAESVIRSAASTFALGIPELGIAPLDPLSLGKVVVNNPALKLTFTDTVVTGLKNMRLNSYKINPSAGKAELDFTANVTLKAHYDMDGQVLILPIRGNGGAKIKITNLNIVVKYDFVDKDGHWDVPSYKDSYKMDRAVFKFQNLFNGNTQLANTVHTVVNANWEAVMNDIAPVAFQTIIKSCVNEVKKLFYEVPTADLLLP